MSVLLLFPGCSDKVVCYSCGVELCEWSEDADVWKTHARVSPTCLHVINHKGQDFIAQSAATEVTVAAASCLCSCGYALPVARAVSVAI